MAPIWGRKQAASLRAVGMVCREGETFSLHEPAKAADGRTGEAAGRENDCASKNAAAALFSGLRAGQMWVGLAGRREAAGCRALLGAGWGLRLSERLRTTCLRYSLGVEPTARLKMRGEVADVRDADPGGDLIHPKALLAQQLFGVLDAQRLQILDEAHPDLAFEAGGEVAGRDLQRFRQPLEGEIPLVVVPLEIVECLGDQRGEMAVPIEGDMLDRVGDFPDQKGLEGVESVGAGDAGKGRRRAGVMLCRSIPMPVIRSLTTQISPMAKRWKRLREKPPVRSRSTTWLSSPSRFSTRPSRDLDDDLAAHVAVEEVGIFLQLLAGEDVETELLMQPVEAGERRLERLKTSARPPAA